MKLFNLSSFIVLFLTNYIFATSLSDPFTFDSGSFPRGVLIANFDTDANNEILVTNFGDETLIGSENISNINSSISLFKYTDNSLSKNNLTSGNSPRGLCAGDINGNGYNDFIVSNYKDGTITIFYNQNGSSFTQQDISVGKHPVGIDIGFIDNNSKKKNDIAVALYSSRKIIILTQNSKGQWEKDEIQIQGRPSDVAIGKFNGQRILAVSDFLSGKVYIYKKTGRNIKLLKEIVSGSGTSKVKIKDVTGDKKNDIIATNLFEHTFIVYDIKNDITQKYNLSGKGPNGFDVGDINNNGLNDIVIANRDSSSLEIFIQSNNGLVKAREINIENAGLKFGPVDVAIGDINNNGLNDIVFSNKSTGELKVIYQDLPLEPLIAGTGGSSFGKLSTACYKISSQEDLTGIAGYSYIFSDSKQFDLKHSSYTEESVICPSGEEIKMNYLLVSSIDNSGNRSPVAVYRVGPLEELSQKTVYNFPNPAKAQTTIRFPLKEAQEIKIIITDSKGTPVWSRQLTKSDTTKGINYITWDLINDSGITVSNGIYLFKLITQNEVINKKIAVVR